MAGGVVLRNVQGTAAGGQQRQQRLEQGGPIRPGGRIKVRRRPGVAPPQAYPGKLPGQVLREAKLVRYVIDVSRVIRSRLKMVVANGRTFVDERLIYTAKDLRVGLFQSTEGF